MEKKKKGQRRRAPRSRALPSHEELLQYEPLVRSIATYFHAMNAGVDLDDLVQEGWLGLLHGVRHWDRRRGITIGAFSHKYIFGRIYRSLVGTKNLIHNKRMVVTDYSDSPVRPVDDKGYDLVEFMEGLGDDPVGREVLRMLFEGHRKGEIQRALHITPEAFRAHVDAWLSKIEQPRQLVTGARSPRKKGNA